MYLSPILNRSFLGALVPTLCLRKSPSFSVTIHSFTRLPSSRPMIVALVRCSDMTFSNRIQKTNKWIDLQSYRTERRKLSESVGIGRAQGHMHSYISLENRNFLSYCILQDKSSITNLKAK